MHKNTRNPTKNDITQPNSPDEEIIKTEGNEEYVSTGGPLGVGSNMDVIQSENIHENDTIPLVPGVETTEA